MQRGHDSQATWDVNDRFKQSLYLEIFELIYDLAKEQFITVSPMAASKKSSRTFQQLTQNSQKRQQVAWSYSQENTGKHASFSQGYIFNSEPIIY